MNHRLYRQHSESYRTECPKVINKIQNDLYLDNLVSDGQT